MKNLLTGYVLTMVALTAVDSFGSIMHSLCGYVSSAIDLKTAQKQKEIKKIADSLEQEPSLVKAIGFATEQEEGDDDDDSET